MSSRTLPSVLVTGAARRLGKTIAERFAAAGWHVVIHHLHSDDDAESLAAALPSAEVVSFDLADSDAIESCVNDLAARVEGWCALINCASIFEFDDARLIDHDTFDHSMKINAEGPVLLAQRYLAKARTQTGRCVINVLDQKLANMNPDFFSYTMAKAALASATEMLAMARRGTPDRIYGLCPGAMLPSFDQVEAEHEASGRMNLLHRLTDPDELADAALFLASGVAASGQVLYVDSGQHLMQQERDVLFLARGDSQTDARLPLASDG
ncbi:SDR family oxidoreductase [Croceicoccus bisphenolivorans]|uniref:SDR family oxidoreductase n=1 Tax=Croceicoccus bisphenolivorans TaxID=1783232 RepID=UPI00082B35C4|nr:SDR family oxidoreductase [Croceicoccus bisphenolivorans]